MFNKVIHEHQQIVYVNSSPPREEQENQPDPALVFMFKAICWLVAIAAIAALAVVAGGIALVVGALFGAGWLIYKSAPAMEQGAVAAGSFAGSGLMLLLKGAGYALIGITSPIWGTVWLIGQGAGALIEAHGHRQQVKAYAIAEARRLEAQQVQKRIATEQAQEQERKQREQQNFELERLRLLNESRKLDLLEKMAEMRPLRGLLEQGLQSENTQTIDSQVYVMNISELHKQS